MSFSIKDKKKKKSLSLKLKLEVYQELKAGVAPSAVASKFSISRSTISDIKKFSGPKIEAFLSANPHLEWRKTLKSGAYPRLETTLNYRYYQVNIRISIVYVFFPPNTTSLIQPMDQGVLDTLKRHYRRKLMRRALDEKNEHKSMAEVKKTISVKDAIEWSSMAWGDITPYTLSSSWNMILPSIENPQVVNQETSSDENPPGYCVNEDDEDIGHVEMSTDEIIEFSLGNRGFQEEPLEDSIPMPEILSVSEAVNLLKTILPTIENDLASTREEIFVFQSIISRWSIKLSASQDPHFTQ